MAVNFRDGDVSYHSAARVLRVTYDSIHALVKSGKLQGGRYPHNQRGRYVTWESVCRLHDARLRAQTAAYDAARKQLEGAFPHE